MKIKKIKLVNFMAFEKLDINFTNNINNSEQDIELDIVNKTKDGKTVIPYITGILGRNSIGKSSIISAIKLFGQNFSDFYRKKAMDKDDYFDIDDFFNSKFERHGKSTRIRNSSKNEILESENKKKIEELKIKNYISKLHRNIFNQYSRIKSKQMTIEITFDDKHSSSIELNYLSNIEENSIYMPKIIFNNNYFENNYYKMFLNKIREWSKDIITFNFVEIDQFFYWDNFESEVEEFTELMKKLKRKNDLDDLIRLSNPNFLEFIYDEGALRFTEKGVNKPLSLKSFSNGTKKFIKLMWTILNFSQSKNGVLLIDEIELYLHNELVNVIKIALMSIATKYDLQIIFTTHNPLVLNKYFSNKQIISLEDIEDGRIVSVKASTKMKPRNSIINKYINGEIAMHPSPDYAKEASWRIFKKW